MGDRSLSSPSLLFRCVVTSIYVAGAVSGASVGAFGVYLILAPLLTAPSFLVFGLACGLPIIFVCIYYLTFVLRLLFSKQSELRRYKVHSWVSALIGACVLLGIAFLIAANLTGI